jgi:uncharacterized protein YjbI with pentapeptide repeats
MTGEAMNQSETSQRVRFEEVSPANIGAAFLDASIESLVVPLDLPIYDGYDGLDDLQLTFLTLPSGATVTLASYLNSPQPGTSIHVDSAMHNIPQIIFESCQQLQVSREEVLWFHPDWQDEIDRLYAEHGAIEKRQKPLQGEELRQSIYYEPIDCFNHALRIYTRQDFPLYWAMLQHNLGLAYFNRSKGSHLQNLQLSIKCFKYSLDFYNKDEFIEKWQLNQHSLKKSQQSLKLLKKKNLIKNIIARPRLFRKLNGVDLIRANLRGANLGYANLINAKLGSIDLSGAELNNANLSNAKLGSGNLTVANLSDAHLINAKLGSVNFSKANLSNANLTGADMSGANLSFVNLNRSNMSHAKLEGADLIDANLSDANLSFAKLKGANLKGADVHNTRFKSNSGISPSLKQDLIARGAIFDDPPKDRARSRNLVPR